MTETPITQLRSVPWATRRLGLEKDARTHELLRRGIIPGVKIGRQWRIDPEALEAWIKSGGQSLPGGWRRSAQ